LLRLLLLLLLRLTLLLRLLLLLLLLLSLALLLLLWHLLTRLLLRRFALLHLWRRLTFLLLRSNLTLLLRNRLSLLLLLWSLALLLLRSDLTLLLRSGLIVHRHLGRNLDVAIGREGLADGDIGRASVVGVGKLRAIGAGSLLILLLGPHGCGVRLTQRSQLGGPGAHLDSTLSAVEADACAAATATNRAAVDVALNIAVDVVDRAVVVEVASAPVAALVAGADVSEAVVDAAIVADVAAPVSAIEAVAVIPEAPVAGGPECALVGSLNPRAGHPVITHWSPSPIAGRPDEVVAGILGLIVVGQRRWRLRSVRVWLFTVTRIVRRLILRWWICVPLIGRRRALLCGI